MKLLSANATTISFGWPGGRSSTGAPPWPRVDAPPVRGPFSCDGWQSRSHSSLSLLSRSATAERLDLWACPFNDQLTRTRSDLTAVDSSPDCYRADSGTNCARWRRLHSGYLGFISGQWEEMSLYEQSIGLIHHLYHLWSQYPFWLIIILFLSIVFWQPLILQDIMFPRRPESSSEYNSPDQICKQLKGTVSKSLFFNLPPQYSPPERNVSPLQAILFDTATFSHGWFSGSGYISMWSEMSGKQ